MRFLCRTCNPPNGYLFISDTPKCPSCRRVNNIHQVRTVHWMCIDVDGIIQGYEGERQYIACMPKRPHLNDVMATGDQSYVNCPKCIASKVFQDKWEEWRATFPDLAEGWDARQVLKLA